MCCRKSDRTKSRRSKLLSVQDLVREGEVLGSQTVRDMLLGSSLILQNLGAHELKGVDGNWQIYGASR